MKVSRLILALAATLSLAASCSTTRCLQEDEYSLTRNRIILDETSDVKASKLSSYFKQQAGSWSPFVYVYNWGGLSDSRLADLCRKIGKAPVVYDPDQVYSSTENITHHLEYLGYYGSVVTADVDTLGRKVEVNYSVHPGKRYLIDEIQYQVPQYGTFADEFREDSTRMIVKVGDYLSEESLEAETTRGATYFRNLGYYTFSKNNYFFEADTISQPGKTVLTYAINDYTRAGGPSTAQELMKYRFGKVDISYPKTIRMRESVLRQLNTIKPGNLYDEATVSNTYNRLSALKVFNGVGVELAPQDDATVDADIRLSQSEVQGIKTNLEASTNSTGLVGISPQLSWYHKNIFHGGEWLNFSVLGNFQFKFNDRSIRSNEFGVSSSLSFPKFLGLGYNRFQGSNIPRTEVKVSYNYQDRPEFTRNIASASYGYTGSLGSRLFYQFYPFSLSFVNLGNMEDSFRQSIAKIPYMMYTYQDHLDAGLSGMLYYTTNSDIVPKTSYHYERLAVDLSGNAVSLFGSMMKTDDNGQKMLLGAPYTQYVRSELTLGRTLRWGDETKPKAIAARVVLGAGYAYGNSTALPYEKQFYCGGASSMRGWQARAVGPGFEELNETFSIPSQTGDLKFEADLEYRARLFWKVEGAIFAEVGNVWNTQYSNEYLKSLAGDWGLGVRIDLDFILLRLDAGFRVHDPARPEGERWVSAGDWLGRNGHAIHFGVGYPF